VGVHLHVVAPPMADGNSESLSTSQQGNGGSISQRPIRSARTWRGNIIQVRAGLLLRFNSPDVTVTRPALTVLTLGRGFRGGENR
jgi:hypothetical protein